MYVYCICKLKNVNNRPFPHFPDLNLKLNVIDVFNGVTPFIAVKKVNFFRLVAASDKVYELLAHGRWFSPGSPASSTTKTGRHDIAEILLKVALNTRNQQTEKNISVNRNRNVCMYKTLM
jgi:hypothetical protein